jgi:hypothetical protein
MLERAERLGRSRTSEIEYGRLTGYDALSGDIIVTR